MLQAMMEAGKLTERITIQRPGVVRDAYGATQTSWVNVVTNLPAAVNYIRGDREIDNEEIFHGRITTFSIRWQGDVNEEMRILWGDLKYRILSIDRRTHRREYMIRTELINE
jgi:SPP1 family predicted phage head-tail adaptor